MWAGQSSERRPSIAGRFPSTLPGAGKKKREPLSFEPSRPESHGLSADAREEWFPPFPLRSFEKRRLHAANEDKIDRNELELKSKGKVNLRLLQIQRVSWDPVIYATECITRGSKMEENGKDLFWGTKWPYDIIWMSGEKASIRR